MILRNILYTHYNLSSRRISFLGVKFFWRFLASILNSILNLFTVNINQPKIKQNQKNWFYFWLIIGRSTIVKQTLL